MDGFQKYLNGMMGVSDQTFEEYSPEAVATRKERDAKIQAVLSKLADLEQRINGLKENSPNGDDAQRRINKMMGITDEVWQKYRHQG